MRVVKKDRESAYDFVELAHEAARLYVDNRRSWGSLVSHFNNNQRARSRLIDVPERYATRVVADVSEKTEEGPLEEMLAKRQSTRSFSSSAVEMSAIFTLLQRAVMARQEGDQELNGRRPYASAGGIYSIEHYVLCLNISGKEQPSTAYCDSRSGRLLHVDSQAPREALLTSLGLREDGETVPAFAIVQTIDIERSTRKYQERGYRFGLLEAGLSAQTLCLVGTSMGLGSIIWGGYYDHLLDDELRIRGTSETTINVVLFGRMPE
jgi:SagB-type dehydrogenase family enzyme